jgi:hypothetical protein
VGVFHHLEGERVAEASTELHEPAAKLTPQTIDRHRAIVSLMEELEAVDWYDQRIDAAADDELRAILRRNRDEEKEQRGHGARMATPPRRGVGRASAYLSILIASDLGVGGERR